MLFHYEKILDIVKDMEAVLAMPMVEGSNNRSSSSQWDTVAVMGRKIILSRRIKVTKVINNRQIMVKQL